MTDVKYDAELCERLEREAREDDIEMERNWRASEHGIGNPEWFVSMNPGYTMRSLTQRRAEAIARTRNNLIAIADQLAAARAEIERLRRGALAQQAHDRKLIGELENYVDLKPSRETLIAERDAMRPVVEAAIALIPEWRDTSGSASNHDAIMERGEELVRAAEAYRTARDKAGKP